MNFQTVQRILGQLLMLFSVTMLPPVGVSLYFGDGHWQPFFDSFCGMLAVGALIWWPARKAHRDSDSRRRAGTRSWGSDHKAKLRRR